MTEPDASPRPGWWGTLVLAAAAAALAAAAAFVMFSAFMFYDDEGYVLLSLRNFSEHGRLYRDVYTQYGPFPFVVYWLLHTVGMPITHMSGRVITVLAWAGTALTCAAMVRHATRSVVVALVVLPSTLSYLWVMASEPSHPGGLIVLAIAMAAALGHRWLSAGLEQRWAAIVGVVAAALLLTKINVGAFFVLSVAGWLLLNARHDTIRRRAPLVMGIGGVLLPLALMRPLLNVDWIQTYALVFALSSVAMFLAVGSTGTARAGRREIAVAIAAGAITGGLILAVVFSRGTSPMELINGILLGPLKHPTSFSLPYKWPVGTASLGVVSLLLCVAAWQLRRRGVAMVDPMVASLRLVAVLGIAAAVFVFPRHSPDQTIFAFALPCLWLLVWPLPGTEPRARTACGWLALLSLGQSLHAFPVAGSQIAWGTFLILPLTAISGWEGVRWLGCHFATLPPRGRRVLNVLLRCAAVAFALILAARFTTVAERYRDGSDLDLPGAELIRVPTSSTAMFRLLTINAVAHADVLFSEPEMASFNLWSGVPTPTLANVTHWFSLLSDVQQRAIIRVLEEKPRACVIVHRPHLDYLRQLGFIAAGRLHDHIAQHFTPAFSVDGFEFCVRRGRTIEPFMLGEIFLRNDVPESDPEDTLLTMRLVLPAGRPIARIELMPASAIGGGRLSFHSGNARVEALPINLRGLPAGAPKALPWPLQVDGVVKLTIHYDRSAQPSPLAGSLITLRGADGAEIALARLKQ
ncbi:MAG: hypothetical protein Q7S40_03935 [Opitutaceae bacterium]|nr:hypothetical protein [Opitutaceae bacterium]